MQEDGYLNPKHFNKWLQRVKTISSESGHLDVSFYHIGSVLIHSPADPKGLWIDKVIAEALNDQDAKKMRDGYRDGIYNSRGAYFVDPSGKPEREFAEQFYQKAEAVENASFHRFATMLKSLAENYKQEAEKIIYEHK